MDLKTLADTPPWEWPPNAATMILDVLTRSRAAKSERLLAAELAGNMVVVNDRIVEALLAIVKNSEVSAQLRGRCAISLGPVLEQAEADGFDEPEKVPIAPQTFAKIKQTLRALYMDSTIPKEVRRCILEASVRAGAPWHDQAIREAYASGDEEWMVTAVFAMRFERGFEPKILEALQSRTPDIHRQAVMAAGSCELGMAWPHLVELIKDPKTPKDLLLAAIEAAGAIRPDDAGPLLATLLDSDDEDIVEAATEAMSMAEILDDGQPEEDEGEGGNWVN